MAIVPNQAIFLRKIASLILVANEIGSQQGYVLTSGDFYRDPRCGYGSRRSLHRDRLAADLNIIKGGRLIEDDTFHKDLHKIWSMMGGSDMIRGDSNHYSLPRDNLV